jgi:hypothetical protein
MPWRKLGRIFAPDGTSDWARVGFMTPTPLARGDGTIRIYGGMRDAEGISRIGWIDVDAADPVQVRAVSRMPALDLGRPGMFDDNGVILGDVIDLGAGGIAMYYVGFQLPQKAKFMAFSGLAISRDGGDRFERVQETPVLDRAPGRGFINAIHSVERQARGYRIWFSSGDGWERIDGVDYPRYACWTVASPDGRRFDMDKAVPILDPGPGEYRIGRPRATRLGDGSYELRVTSDTLDKQYACFLAHSPDGIHFTRSDTCELPRGAPGDWDDRMTCYPARIDLADGRRYLVYNGNDMGRTGVGAAIWEA